MQPNHVSLTKGEAVDAAYLGIRRHLAAVFAGLPGRYSVGEDNGFEYHCQGASAECAFAKWADVPWSRSIGAFGKPDFVVGGIAIDVKQRPGGKLQDLILRGEIKANWVYVLVIGRSPHFEIAGWIRGDEAEPRGTRRDPGNRGNFGLFVDKEPLNTPETLKAALANWLGGQCVVPTERGAL